MTPLRIAFYNPVALQTGSYKRARPPVVQIGMAKEAEKAGATVRIVDVSTTTSQLALRELESFRPDVICITTYHDQSCQTRTKQVIDQFRGRAKVIIGGHSATKDTVNAIELYRPDLVGLGEGEIIMRELVAANLNLKRLNNDLVQLGSINGTPTIRAIRRYELDQLPLPSEMPDIFPVRQSWAEAIVNVARGCVGRCTFCDGADSKLSYMSPARVIEHLLDWYRLRSRYMDLMAPDLTSDPVKATQIIREINNYGQLQGLQYFFSVRLDTMARALEYDPEAWQTFIDHNQVTIEVGWETGVPRRLGPGHFNKTRKAEEHTPQLERILATGAKVAVDMISFDPLTSLQEIKDDYRQLHGLARIYPNMTIYPEAIFRSLMLFPGTKAAEVFGRGNLTPKANPDRRIRFLLTKLRNNNAVFGISEQRSLAATLERICKLIDFIQSRFPSPDREPSHTVIDNFIENLSR